MGYAAASVRSKTHSNAATTRSASLVVMPRKNGRRAPRAAAPVQLWPIAARFLSLKHRPFLVNPIVTMIPEILRPR